MEDYVKRPICDEVKHNGVQAVDITVGVLILHSLFLLLAVLLNHLEERVVLLFVFLVLVLHYAMKQIIDLKCTRHQSCLLYFTEQLISE